jgi:hypothetical protein
MKKVLVLVFAFSIALTGCKKEAEQIVSKPLDTVKGAAVAASASPTPTPSQTVIRTATPTPSASASPIPADKEALKGAGEEIYNPLWLKALTVFLATAMATMLAVGFYQVFKDGGDVEDASSGLAEASSDGIGTEVADLAAVAAGH